MIVLAFETSCDDTCAAILRDRGSGSKPRFDILSNIVSSQVKLHRKYGGVYPFLAKREHLKNLPLVLKKATLEAKNPKIDFLAVTAGPGLEPCLWTGINFAKKLAEKKGLPIVPVNHIEAHIAANFIEKDSFKFPAIGLVVSGGHTQIILMKSFGKYEVMGETRDDAAGECFDKAAKILGLEYPGGPVIAALAEKSEAADLRLPRRLPRPMINQKNYEFSFSGLKTAVLYEHRRQPPKTRKSEKYIATMAGEVQRAIIDVLVHKTMKAAKDCRAKTIILGGGVASNKELRERFREKLEKESLDLEFAVPSKKLCTDNAAMTAVAACFHWPESKTLPEKIEADANLRI